MPKPRPEASPSWDYSIEWLSWSDENTSTPGRWPSAPDPTVALQGIVQSIGISLSDVTLFFCAQGD